MEDFKSWDSNVQKLRFLRSLFDELELSYLEVKLLRASDKFQVARIQCVEVQLI